jgi:hypothetical protein
MHLLKYIIEMYKYALASISQLIHISIRFLRYATEHISVFACLDTPLLISVCVCLGKPLTSDHYTLS